MRVRLACGPHPHPGTPRRRGPRVLWKREEGRRTGEDQTVPAATEDVVGTRPRLLLGHPVHSRDVSNPVGPGSEER